MQEEPLRPHRGTRDLVLAAQDRGQGFGNARLVRNLFEAVVARQASRVVARPAAEVTDDELVAIEAVDVSPPPVIPLPVAPPPVSVPPVSVPPVGPPPEVPATGGPAPSPGPTP